MTEKKSITQQIYGYTLGKIKYLHGMAGTGSGRGMMAVMRRGVGKYPGEIPELWGMIFNNMPDELFESGEIIFPEREASYVEWAVYTALTLYALHQQGNEKLMHSENVSIGKAASMLVKDEDDEERICRRLGLVVTAASPKDLAYHLRGLIRLLSDQAIAIDYARLAKELYLMNYEESSRNVKLAWGRDFYNRKKAKKTEEEK